jgi:methionine aminopeptidase
MSVTIKTAEEIESMRVACRLASEVLDFIEPHVRPASRRRNWIVFATTTW